VPIPGDDRYGSKHAMDPSDETQTPIAGIQPDDARTNIVEANGPLQQWLAKGASWTLAGERRKKMGKPEPRHNSVWTR